MKKFDVIITGGSYAGLAAAMALGRSMHKTLVVDSDLPANRQTPFAHNILTRDGMPPAQLRSIAKKHVAFYPTVTLMTGLVVAGEKTGEGFRVTLASGEIFYADKLIFATGIKDLCPSIPGFSDCWGISVLHCPYCHGYEVRNAATGVLADGSAGFDLAKLISNWSNQLTLFTNGPSTLDHLQKQKLAKHSIPVVETPVEIIYHVNGHMTGIQLSGNCLFPLAALYTQVTFEQHSLVPQELGCALTNEGYIEVNAAFETTVPGVYAAGDNVTRLRTVAGAIGMGTAVGMLISKKLIMESF